MTDLREFLDGIEQAYNKAVKGLLGTPDSLSYKVAEIENHIHSSEQVYGNVVSTMGPDAPIPFIVVGGSNAWGQELLITSGTTIESGNAAKKFDLNTLYLVSSSVANKISILEFLSGTWGPEVTAVVVATGTGILTKIGHGLVNGDKLTITDCTTPTGVVSYEVYYVIGVAGNTFQLSKSLGGASITWGGTDGTIAFKEVFQTSITKCVVSMGTVNSSASPLKMNAPRVGCDQMIFVRAKSETGQTVSIGFLLGLHTYAG